MTDEINDGGPAFPPTFGPSGEYGSGMSLRDWYAGQALIVAWKAYSNGYYESDTPTKDIAQHAYQLADAMIAARSAK